MFTIPIGPTGDEGWFRGQCRFSKLATAWGEFYEIQGDLLLDKLDDEWIEVPSSNASEDHHYLFYFRDETFECDAAS